MLPTTTVRVDPTKLKTRMETQKMSIRAVGRRAGCAPSRIAQLTNGKDPGVAVGIAVSIAQALDADVAELFSFPDGEALIKLGLIRAV